MSDSILNIIINTVKKGGGDKEAVTGLQKMSKSFKELTGFSLGSVTAIGAVSGAATGLYKIIKDSVSVYVDYANAVRTVRDETTLTAEEASRVIQLMDDYKLSTEEVIKSQKFLAAQGKSLSVETLAEMSDAYVKLNTGSEKTNYLMQNLGRNGAKYAEVLSKGSEEIYAQADAISAKLILDDKALQKARNLELAQDNLNDSWMEYQLIIGSKVIPELDLLLRVLTPGKDELEAQAQAINLVENKISKLAGAAAMGSQVAKAKIAELKIELEKLNQAYYGNAESSKAATEAQEGLTAQLSDFKTIMGGAFGEEIEKFNGKLGDQRDKAAEIQAKIDELNGKSWLTTEQKQELADLKQNLLDNAIETGKLRDEHDRTMKTMAMNMIITKAASDGLTATEVDNIGKIMVSWGLWDEKTAEVVENINGINLDDAKVQLDGINQALGNIFSQPNEKNIRIITEYITQGGPGTHTSGNIGKAEVDAGVDLNGNGVIGAANGLDFKVPPGFPNDSYFLPLAVTSGEQVNVTPAGAGGAGGGGNIIHIHVNGTGDPDLVANRVMQKLRLQMGVR